MRQKERINNNRQALDSTSKPHRQLSSQGSARLQESFCLSATGRRTAQPCHLPAFVTASGLEMRESRIFT